MTPSHAERIDRHIKVIRAALATVLVECDELSDLLQQVRSGIAGPPLAPVEQAEQLLRIDRTTYTVRWRGGSCFLGSTMGFRLLERLARRPNEFISTVRLLDELWGGTRTPSTVRSTVWGLRTKLRSAGLQELADLIDGSSAGHYRLRTINA